VKEGRGVFYFPGKEKRCYILWAQHRREEQNLTPVHPGKEKRGKALAILEGEGWAGGESESLYSNLEDEKGGFIPIGERMGI